MAVDIRIAGSSVAPGVPRSLFPSSYYNSDHVGPGLGTFSYHAYSLSAEGQRFLIPQLNTGVASGILADQIAVQADRGGNPSASANAIVVVLHWPLMLNKK